MIVFWGIGAAFLVFSPANLDRAGNQIGWTALSFCRMLSYSRLFIIMCFIILCLFIRSKYETLHFLKENLDLLIGIFGGFILFSIISYSFPRAGYGVDILSVVVSCRALNLFFKNDFYVECIAIFTNIFAVVFIVMSLIFQQRSNVRMDELTSQLDNNVGEKDFYFVKPLKCPSFFTRYILTGACPNNPYSEWHNIVYSWKYDLDKIIVLSSNDGLMKLPGNTNWQFCSNYWFSKSPFPAECRITYHIDYSVDIKHKLIWLVKKVLNQNTNIIKMVDIQLPNNYLRYGPNYYIIDPYLSKSWVVENVYLE